MIQMQGANIVREGTKIGWIQNPWLYNHAGAKVGYITDNKIFDQTGKKVVELAGEYVYSSQTGQKSRLEDEVRGIDAGDLSDLMRVAIKLFFG